MESRFEGSYINFFLILILNSILTFLTLGLAMPWAICNISRWKINNSYIDGKKLYFDGTGSQLFGKFIIWFLLTIITFGLYSFLLVVKQHQWIVSHTHFVD